LLKNIGSELEKSYLNFTLTRKCSNDQRRTCAANSDCLQGAACEVGPTPAYFTHSPNFHFTNDPTKSARNGKVLDTCGNKLPDAWDSTCDRAMAGDTQGCECKGTRMAKTIVVKAMNGEFDSNAERNAANLAAFAAGKPMLDAFEAAAASQDYENKWMYFGAVDGAYALYPGRLWPREKGSDCGKKYDPRIRPWYLSASNGPKNVIFILDSSGSMGQEGRMDLLKTAAKQVVDSLTFADYMGIVDFDDTARTMKSLNFLAPAAAGFRMEAKIFIDKLEAGGGKVAVRGHKSAQDMEAGWMRVLMSLPLGTCVLLVRA
jgi:hypothetical protein